MIEPEQMYARKALSAGMLIGLAVPFLVSLGQQNWLMVGIIIPVGAFAWASFIKYSDATWQGEDESEDGD